MDLKQFKTEWASKELKVEIGQLADQANGSVLLNYGQTTVLATCVMSKRAKDVDFMPLTVDFEEKLYAAGKIKSSRFIKREGRASDEAILSARMVDRVIRPCFDKKIRNEIQIVLTVLSFDKENDPDIPSLLAASLALSISNIPWHGPVAGVRISRNDNKWILNPSYQQRENNDFDLIIAGKNGKINMIEAGTKEVSEEDILSAIEFSQSHLKEIVQFQEKIIGELKPQKAELTLKALDKELVGKVKNWLEDKLEKTIYIEDKKERNNSLDKLLDDLIEAMELDDDETKKREVNMIVEEEIDRIVHQNILKSEKRPDARKLDEVRPIKCQISFLPRTHGSAIFKRGETQALSVVTLGAPSDEQTLEGMEFEGKKHFMHHYNFPAFCVGEVGPMRGPGRREIGHGALAERAIIPLIPDKEKFPYTIRIVSEILSSNGSSSMASASGASLALMDAGVPVKNHVTGVAMGLMMESDDNYKILTDIQGPEDHHGDMDCKIAGTKNGITACQMDVKVEGITLEILKKVFIQAKKGRLDILKEMEKTIGQPRVELSSYAPRIVTLRINPEKIGVVIGPQGKMINEIIDQTGVKIDIEDDGLVNITSTDEEAAKKAVEWIKDLTKEVKAGEIFQGKVTKITDFGAFVEILPGQEGLVHISEMAPYHVKKAEDIVKLGQLIPVKVKKIDEQGRINLTLKGLNE